MVSLYKAYMIDKTIEQVANLRWVVIFKERMAAIIANRKERRFQFVRKN